MKVHIQYEDQFHKWHQIQTMHHLPTAVRSASNRARSTGKRHRIVSESGELLDLLHP